MSELQQLNSKLDEVLRRLDQLNAPLEPAFTKSKFAKRVGVHANTVTRWIAQKKIRIEKGRIPASEARKFIS